MAELFATSKPNISMHISNILKEQELSQEQVVKNYLTTAADGKHYGKKGDFGYIYQDGDSYCIAINFQIRFR